MRYTRLGNSLKVLLICFWFGLLLVGCGVGKDAQVQRQLEAGESYLQNAEYEKALSAFTKAIEMDPQNGAAYTGRGDTYMEMGQYTDAVVEYKAASRFGEHVSDKLEIAIGEAIREISMESGIDTAMQWLEEVQHST